VLVVLRETVRDHTIDLEFGQFVCIACETGRHNPVTVKRATRKKNWVSSLARRQTPADIQFSMLTMFGINELTEWARCQNGGTTVPPVKVNASKVPTESTGPVSLDYGKIAGILDDKSEKRRELADRETKIAGLLRTYLDPKPNGKHDDKK
jgi:hypothetical protein